MGAGIGGIDTKPLWPDSRGSEWLWLQLLGYTSELDCFLQPPVYSLDLQLPKSKAKVSPGFETIFSCYCKLSLLFRTKEKITRPSMFLLFFLPYLDLNQEIKIMIKKCMSCLKSTEHYQGTIKADTMEG